MPQFYVTGDRTAATAFRVTRMAARDDNLESLAGALAEQR